jgi:hypothetical protein
MNDPGAPDFVLQGRKPGVEFFRAQEGVHGLLYPNGYHNATHYSGRRVTWADAA